MGGSGQWKVSFVYFISIGQSFWRIRNKLLILGNIWVLLIFAFCFCLEYNFCFKWAHVIFRFKKLLLKCYKVIRYLYILDFFFPFIFISWRLITLQYCSGFWHTLTWISHGFTVLDFFIPSAPTLKLIYRYSSSYDIIVFQSKIKYYVSWN